MILIPRKRNLPHAAFPSPHPPTPLPHPGVNTALCGQFHGEGCAADMELCDKKSGGDWLFRWVEEKTYGGYFPQPILPIDACEHDPDDKVGKRRPFTPRPTDGKATVPTHTLHYPVPSIAPPTLLSPMCILFPLRSHALPLNTTLYLLRLPRWAALTPSGTSLVSSVCALLTRSARPLHLLRPQKGPCQGVLRQVQR